MSEGSPATSSSPKPRSPLPEERLLAYHRYAREHGANRLLYYLARIVLQPVFLVYLRLSRYGREHTRVDGPLVVAANHRSFLDPFVIGVMLPWSRRLQFVAKVELFENRWQGWLLNRLGAYPVRRGESDQEVLTTSRRILERGGAVVIFPEGTRIRTGALGRPKRGAGRLALESGAAVLPVAVQGTERVRRGWLIRPRRVKLRAGRALTFPRTTSPSPSLANAVSDRIWPAIELQWEWLGGLPPLRRAAVIGAGSWGTAVAVLLARGGLEVQLGCRTAEQAEEIAAKGENARYLPGIELPDTLQVKRATEIELAGLDLICLAVPSKSLPAAVGQFADQIGDRTAVLMLSKGLVAPMGALPTDYLSERVRARAVACLGGPAHAVEACSGSAALVLGSCDPDLRQQLGDVFDDAQLVCERTDDVAGVEIAGAAKNAAALAAAAAEPHGLNAAGIAAAEVWRECVAYALARGARLETFSGLAGVGDLTATILAPGSRNRRAGELLGRGIPPAQIPAKIGQTSEALDSVPLLAQSVAAAGIEAPGLSGLSALVEGNMAAAEWIASVRRAERSRREADSWVIGIAEEV
ncbi:MAG: glycerol-3-phosphate dehydrogenase [Solirubrobacterales bacterium]|nr:glycerol-3-phosphate dehydrogenase [Solirubrobacterales bacterium]MDX6663708.1 glycerol-3-phosphate dehydrogenase [Solirubrobacterales bacterium]